jgi:circadian clock protein KaiB
MVRTSAKTAARSPVRKAAVGKRSRPAREKIYDLHLYISGATEQSRLALANIRAVGEKHLKGRYRLSVVDVYQEPEQARKHEIIAVPALVKELPPPLRRMVGDLSNEERVLIGLDLIPKSVRGEPS